MMRYRKLHRAVRRWLRAEDAAADGAGTALRGVFRALPAPPLGDGFTARVMLAAGLAPRRAAAPLAWRLALGGALVLSAAATSVAPAIAWGVLRRISPADVLQLGATAVVETCQRLAEGLAVWHAASSIGTTLAEALSAPPILAALLAASLLSAGGLRLLHGLLAMDRRSDNARA